MRLAQIRRQCNFIFGQVHLLLIGQAGNDSHRSASTTKPRPVTKLTSRPLPNFSTPHTHTPRKGPLPSDRIGLGSPTATRVMAATSLVPLQAAGDHHARPLLQSI